MNDPEICRTAVWIIRTTGTTASPAEAPEQSVADPPLGEEAESDDRTDRDQLRDQLDVCRVPRQVYTRFVWNQFDLLHVFQGVESQHGTSAWSKPSRFQPALGGNQGTLEKVSLSPSSGCDPADEAPSTAMSSPWEPPLGRRPLWFVAGVSRLSSQYQ